MRAVFLLLLGCTTVHHLAADAPLAPINEALRDREAKVSYKDGKSATTPRAEVARDGLYLEENGARTRAPLEAVQSVRWLSPGHPRARGALEGLAIGLPGGAVLGALIGFASGGDTCNPNQFCILQFSAAEKAALFAVGLGVVGALVGSIVGASIGHHDELIMPGEAPP